MAVRKIENRWFCILDYRNTSDREKIYHYAEKDFPVAVLGVPKGSMPDLDSNSFLIYVDNSTKIKEVAVKKGITVKEEVDDTQDKYFTFIFEITAIMKVCLKEILHDVEKELL